MSFLLSVTNTQAWKNALAYYEICSSQIRKVFILQVPGLTCNKLERLSLQASPAYNIMGSFTKLRIKLSFMNRVPVITDEMFVGVKRSSLLCLQ